MAFQRRPTLKNLLGMYLCHSFELRNEIWFEYYSLYGACFGLDLLTLFGWEDMINFIENLVAKVLGMAFGQFY